MARADLLLKGARVREILWDHKEFFTKECRMINNGIMVVTNQISALNFSSKVSAFFAKNLQPSLNRGFVDNVVR